MKKKTVMLICCIGIITSVISGCGNSENSNPKLASTEDTETKTGDFNIKVVDASYNGIENDYHNFSFTVMNNTDKVIHTITININIMDKDRNIISTTHPQESSRLNPGKNITIEALAEKELNAYYAVVDGYSYYCGEDYVNGYVNESLEVAFDSSLKNDNMDDDASAFINEYPEEYIQTENQNTKQNTLVK